MAILSNGKFYGFLCSVKETGRKLANGVKEYVEDYVSGFSGHGWKLWEYVKGKWKLEIDTIVVRETMVIFELLIQKIRAVKGALNITQASGKIKTAVYDETEQCWMITIEDEMSFVAHDFIRCQDWSNGVIKGYWVEISEIRKVNDADVIIVPLTEFSGGIGYINGMETVIADLSGMTTPVAGDEIVQFGNSENVSRQSAIYIHADESGQPAIDILFGINSKSFAGCVKQRIGGDIPGTDGLKGFYCENGMIKGVNETGHMVYCIYPDGTAEFGDGSARFATDRSGHIAGGAISWRWDDAKQKYVCTMRDVVLTWDNLSDEAKENLKGEPGKDGSNGKDGLDANLLPWIEKWNGYATELGEEYIVTPKMFSGTKSADGKLTGIAQGKDCITAADGTKRTGIFALVNNEIVFELDPITRKYKFKGTVIAESGKIAGFEIDGNKLSNVNGQDCWVSIDMTESDGQRHVATIGNDVPSLAGFKRCAYFSNEGGTDQNVALVLKAKGESPGISGRHLNLAVHAAGGCHWMPAEKDYWCMPGFLIGATAQVKTDGSGSFSYTNIWGDGCVLQDPVKIGDWGMSLIRHNMGHTQYFVQVQPHIPNYDGNWWNTIATLFDKGSDSFSISFRDDSSRGQYPKAFDIMIFGSPSVNAGV